MAIWTQNLKKLKAYKKKYGSFNVPFQWSKDKILAQWVDNIRKSKRALPKPLKAQLLKIGFNFELNPSDNWDYMYGKLKAFYHQFGHTYVPYTTEWEELFYWNTLQRKSARSLPQKRARKLDALNFDWNARGRDDVHWEKMYEALKVFYKKHGRVRIRWNDVEHRKLYDWSRHQIRSRKKLSEDKRKKLNAIGFDWNSHIRNILEERWENRYQELIRFKKEKGHLDVPPGGIKYKQLYTWIRTQRRTYDTMPETRKQKLKKIGILKENVPQLLDKRWEQMYAQLERFYKKHGHLVIPEKKYAPLKGWLFQQKHFRSRLKPERLKKLEALSIDWIEDNKIKKDHKFEEGYKKLKEFHRKHGHCFVPISDKELWTWVYNIRTYHKRRSKDQLNRLKALGFDFAPGRQKINELRWNENFEALKAFSQKNGHCKPTVTKAETKKLGTWVNRQRSKKDMLTADQKRKLKSIGFEWEIKK